MSTPTVSVVLIFRDDETYLPEAIDSVLSQRFSDWELILVDDGSTDGSAAIARLHLSVQPERIRYFTHPGRENRGISATRNLGIQHARGTYVALLDSDDVWNPEKLEEQVAILEAHPTVGLLFGASLYWWSWAGEDAPRADRVRPVGAKQDQVHAPPSLLLALYPLGDGVAPCPSSCIGRRDVFNELGGFEESFRTMYEDQAFLTKAYLHIDIYVSSRCWDRYRRHPQAITLTTSAADYRAVRGRFLEWFEGYARDQGVTDPRIHTAIQRAGWPLRHPKLAAMRHHAGRARARLRRRLAAARNEG